MFADLNYQNSSFGAMGETMSQKLKPAALVLIISDRQTGIYSFFLEMGNMTASSFTHWWVKKNSFQAINMETK